MVDVYSTERKQTVEKKLKDLYHYFRTRHNLACIVSSGQKDSLKFRAIIKVLICIRLLKCIRISLMCTEETADRLSIQNSNNTGNQISNSQTSSQTGSKFPLLIRTISFKKSQRRFKKKINLYDINL